MASTMRFEFIDGVEMVPGTVHILDCMSSLNSLPRCCD